MLKLQQNHPRFLSLFTRERLVEASVSKTVVPQGLIAHGRGEAFDYLIGERTSQTALKAITTAAALLLDAERPVLSVNGNAAALVGKEIIELGRNIPASIEVNLFHSTPKRRMLIAHQLRKLGAKNVLGVGPVPIVRIPGIASRRERADREGIAKADVVLIPLEDGDRAEALRGMGKIVIAIDLNPLSRTSKIASVTIVDNIIRAIPTLTKAVHDLKRSDRSEIDRLKKDFDNEENLAESIRQITRYLDGWMHN